ncbi:CatB-related O-acetyltransferase [Shimia thalassica]|uniref:CatB-related O-acetyltransferase n=1 Tax=Shimia thalassica TaxID=1715693 RepID=UPI0026E20EDF|nr:CatB-related O-acetyltransferase [Shimia thalassica]MDO6521398.1 CatB-related O-acetyltransferase [Shimia thalassica]
MFKHYKMRKRYPDVKIGRHSQVSKDTTIGAHSYIGLNCFVTKAQIGRYVSIGNFASIGNGEHDLNRVSTASMFYENGYDVLTRGDCIIEADVWIGVDAIIRRGVRLGHGCVVGANSFVNKDIPPFAIAVGSPAKIVGYRFDDAETRDAILASHWWEKEPDAARAIIEKLETDLGLSGTSA